MLQNNLFNVVIHLKPIPLQRHNHGMTHSHTNKWWKTKTLKKYTERIHSPEIEAYQGHSWFNLLNEKWVFHQFKMQFVGVILFLVKKRNFFFKGDSTVYFSCKITKYWCVFRSLSLLLIVVHESLLIWATTCTQQIAKFIIIFNVNKRDIYSCGPHHELLCATKHLFPIYALQ